MGGSFPCLRHSSRDKNLIAGGELAGMVARKRTAVVAGLIQTQRRFP
jgi:hypothetical protein